MALDFTKSLLQINKGHLENVLLSYDELSDVLTDESFFGATVGPVAGRIRNATWGKIINLKKNAGNHHIHGGTNGWSFQYWDVEVFKNPQSIGVVFYLQDTFFRLSWSYHSNDHVSANCE